MCQRRKIPAWVWTSNKYLNNSSHAYQLHPWRRWGDYRGDYRLDLLAPLPTCHTCLASPRAMRDLSRLFQVEHAASQSELLQLDVVLVCVAQDVGIPEVPQTMAIGYSAFKCKFPPFEEVSVLISSWTPKASPLGK